MGRGVQQGDRIETCALRMCLLWTSYGQKLGSEPVRLRHTTWLF